MKKNFKMIFFLFLILFLLTGCKKQENRKYNIVSTSFPCYDFARAITKNSSDIGIKMLLKPGSEMHDYEPTPKDIIAIENSDIFIYVGGDSDSWVKDVLDDLNLRKTKIIKLMDLVSLKEEELVEGMETSKIDEKIEYDEHVWTSPRNAITITEKLANEIIEMDKVNKNLYLENTKKYVNEFENLDKEFKEIVKNSKRKEIIFGDRFPIRYFADEYNLTYYAAFPGCSEQTEANAKTISFLINKVKEDNIPVVFHIELSNGKIAETIKKETNVKVLEFQTGHNISQESFKNDITLTSLMMENTKVLKEALN